jgi:hypothetical protein
VKDFRADLVAVAVSAGRDGPVIGVDDQRRNLEQFAFDRIQIALGKDDFVDRPISAGGGSEMFSRAWQSIGRPLVNCG